MGDEPEIIDCTKPKLIVKTDILALENMVKKTMEDIKKDEHYQYEYFNIIMITNDKKVIEFQIARE